LNLPDFQLLQDSFSRNNIFNIRGGKEERNAVHYRVCR